MGFAKRDVPSKSHLEQLFESSSLLMETKHAIRSLKKKKIRPAQQLFS